jgi:hypothetical protein
MAGAAPPPPPSFRYQHPKIWPGIDDFAKAVIFYPIILVRA